MQIFGKFELFRQTFPPTLIYYDLPNLWFFKNFPNYYYGWERTSFYNISDAKKTLFPAHQVTKNKSHAGGGKNIFLRILRD